LTLLIDAAPVVELVIPAPVTAEIDDLLGQRFGGAARRAFLADLASGRFRVSPLERDDYGPALELGSRYADFDLGLADCSLAILADRHRTTRILTFDQRHFRAITPLQGGAFTILPADVTP
jgi:predicted nucleic acid-binding protein